MFGVGSQSIVEFASDCQFGCFQIGFWKACCVHLESLQVFCCCVKGASFVVIYVETIGIDEAASCGVWWFV